MKISIRHLRRLIQEEAGKRPSPLAAFKRLYDEWVPETTEGQRYKQELGKTLSLRGITLDEGQKAPKERKDPPYRERGATESQAQQMAAGMALSARRGETSKSKLKGAAKDLADGEISTKDLRNLAKLGQKVKGHKTKEPERRKDLPGHATLAKD